MMYRRLARPMKDFLRDARVALSMTQAEFGPALGWSHRTAVRWERGRSYPMEETVIKLAALLISVDHDLASEAALAVGQSLESLGLVPAKPASEARSATRDDLADAVVCAVADATDLLPRALRPLLHAAFARARALGLTVEELEESLRPRVEAKADKERVRLRVRVEREDAEPRRGEAAIESPAPPRRTRTR